MLLNHGEAVIWEQIRPVRSEKLCLFSACVGYVFPRGLGLDSSALFPADWSPRKCCAWLLRLSPKKVTRHTSNNIQLTSWGWSFLMFFGSLHVFLHANSRTAPWGWCFDRHQPLGWSSTLSNGAGAVYVDTLVPLFQQFLLLPFPLKQSATLLILYKCHEHYVMFWCNELLQCQIAQGDPKFFGYWNKIQNSHQFSWF